MQMSALSLRLISVQRNFCSRSSSLTYRGHFFVILALSSLGDVLPLKDAFLALFNGSQFFFGSINKGIISQKPIFVASLNHVWPQKIICAFLAPSNGAQFIPRFWPRPMARCDIWYQFQRDK